MLGGSPFECGHLIRVSCWFGSGLTHSNYKELNALYKNYKDEGSCYYLSYCFPRWLVSFVILWSIIISYSHNVFIGLEILAFPCNQFGGQEPGSNDEIKELTCTVFKAEFPIFDKVSMDLG